MRNKFKGFLPILAFSLIPTLLIWVPFFFRMTEFWNIPLPNMGMATIVSNYDGPLFLVVAKTFYNTASINQNFEFGLPDIYYSAHYPMFPILIRLLGFVINFPYAMLTVTVLSSILATYYFHKLALDYVNEKDAVWLTFVFSILPARWLIVRSVGSSEPLFIAAIIASVYYFKNKKYWWAALFGVVAQLTKSPGILLFVAYVLSIFIPNLKKVAFTSLEKWISRLKLRQVYPIFLIPLSLLGLFYFYGIRYGNFMAYFNSGDNIHLFFPPFQIFNYSAPWVGTFWLEEIILIYLLGILGFLRLFQKKENLMAWFVGVFFVTILFVSHRDVIRYSLPIVPFLIIGWRDVIISRDFKIALTVLVIPIYLFSLAYISQNVMQISNWAPLL
jgi:hypothetical protein